MNIGYRYWKTVINTTSPSGKVKMYEFYNKENSQTLFTLGVDSRTDDNWAERVYEGLKHGPLKADK